MFKHVLASAFCALTFLPLTSCATTKDYNDAVANAKWYQTQLHEKEEQLARTDEDELEVESTGLAPAIVEEGPTEGAGIKLALILTSLLLLLAVPLVLSASKGEFSTAAQTIAGLFGHGKG